MKGNSSVIVLFFILSNLVSMAQEPVIPDTLWQVKGRVVDLKSGMPIENASVMFFSANKYRGGTITDSLGYFKLALKQAGYGYRISCLGYKYKDLQIILKGDSDVGDIPLEIASVELAEAVVKHKLIERKADRIIMNMIGNPFAAGRDAFSMLYQIPGVWGLSIYGRRDARVFINGRELQMPPGEVANYLSGLSADNVLQYEVIPYAGARFDGNTSGGVILITLRKAMKGGIKGSARLSMSSNSKNLSITPSFSLFTQKGKFYTYTYLNNSNLFFNKEEQNNEVIYLDRDASIREQYCTKQTNSNLIFDQSVVYNLSDKQTIGASFYMLIKPNEKFKRNGSTFSYGIPNKSIPALDSNYQLTTQKTLKTEAYYYNASLDYTIRLDSSNSNLRFVANYLSYTDQDHTNRKEYYLLDDAELEVLTRDKNLADKNTFQTYCDWSWTINQKSNFEAGVKFLGLWADGDAMYENWKANRWEKDYNASNLYKYHEYISAGYLNFSSSIGKKWMYSLGMRIEDTQTVFESLKVNESNELHYTSFFPAANIAYDLNKDKGHFLVLNYNRKISRPTYSDLDPSSYKASEHVYSKGNSKLKPSFENSVAINLTLHSNYSINLSAEWENDIYDDILTSIGDTLYWESLNYGKVIRGRCYASSRHKLTKWWSMNFNLGLILQRERTQNWENTQSFGVNLSCGNSIQLPHKWSINYSVSYSYPLKDITNSSRVQSLRMNGGVYKTLTRCIDVNFNAYTGNILGNYTSEQTNANFRYKSEFLFTMNSFSIGISYRFEKGKEVKEKRVRVDSEANERSGK